MKFSLDSVTVLLYKTQLTAFGCQTVQLFYLITPRDSRRDSMNHCNSQRQHTLLPIQPFIIQSLNCSKFAGLDLFFCILMLASVCVHIYTLSHTETFAHARTHVYIQNVTHARARTHARTRIHTHSHKHTHTQHTLTWHILAHTRASSRTHT